MAATTGLLTTQLRNRLSNEDEPIEKRLEVAYTVFCSSAIPIVQKEEQVLSWILTNLEKATPEKEVLYSSLTNCLKSRRIHSFAGNIRPAVISQLLSVLNYEESVSASIKSSIRSCCVEILNIPYFLRWFMCDVSSACKIGASYLKTLDDSDAFVEFGKALKQLLYIQKMTLLKAEFRIRFIKEVLDPLFEALVHVYPDDKKMLFCEATNCLREVLFYEPKFIESFISCSLSKTDECSKEVKSFCKKLKYLPTKAGRSEVEIFYSLFLRSVISKYPDDFNRVFHVFTILCPPLGIIVDRIISIEMSPIPNWDVDDTFYVIKALVDVLDSSKIPLTCQLEEVSLQNWFTSLVIGLTNINSRTMGSNFFRMVERVYEFNPLVIEPSAKIITMIMLRKKAADLKSPYISLVATVIKGSAKLQRLQKFVSFFLENMKDYLMMSCEEDLILEDVLPAEVQEGFSNAAALLPTAQVLSMTKSFLFHLQRDCANQVEAYRIDTAVIINVEVISNLLNILLRSTNIIHHSVPDIVKTKYKYLLEELQVLLKLFGMVYQDLHEDRLLKSYLILCRAFGAMKLLFREYDDIQIVKPMDVDLEPTNISYVHNYLEPEAWKRIAESIEDHENCKAHHEFFELLVQKVEAVSQVEEGYEGPGTQAARYLLQFSDKEWLWSHFLTLAPLFQSAELIKLVSKLIKHLGNDQSLWLPFLKKDAFTENRRLVLALEFSLLSKASKKLQKSDEEEESLSRQVLSLVNVEEILEFELSQLITEDEELRESVEGFIAEMAALLNENLLNIDSYSEKVPHPSMIEVPARLPIHHLSGESQGCALLAALAILHDTPPNSQFDMYLFNLLLKILDGSQKGNSSLLSGLNPGTFLRFVSRRGSSYRGQRKLLKRICFLGFRSKRSAKQLFSAVDEPTAENLWLTAIVIDCLIQVKKKFLGSEDSKKPLERKKCLEHLLDGAIPILCSEDPSLELLYSFSVVFNYTLRYLPSLAEQYAQLRPLLQKYIAFALSNYGEGERLVEGLIEHRAELEENFPSSLIESTFREMCGQLLPPPEPLTHLLFGAATPTEFSSIVSHLLSLTRGKEFEEDCQLCRRVILLWSHLFSGHLSSEKSREREEALQHLMVRLAAIPPLWAKSSALHLVCPLLELVAVIARNTSVVLKPFVIDGALLLMSEVPLGENLEPDVILTYLTAVLDAMFALYLFRTSLLIDRIPPFLQRYRQCLVTLAKLASPTAPYPFLKKAASLAEKLERAATTLVKRRKDFGRLAPYLIADLLSIFQKYNLSSEVKFSYTNIVNAFLSIADSHGVAFLKAVLPTGQQELFNNIYENYNKFHRFVGKI